jgi:hypothetical protein
MNWYMTALAGVLRITDDMTAFANEVTEEFKTRKDLPRFGVFYQRQVTGPFGKSKLITVDWIGTPELQYSLSAGPRRKRRKGGAMQANKCYENKANITINLTPGSVKRENVLHMLEHELVHCFDPKLELYSLRHAPWRATEHFLDHQGQFKNDLETYHRYPWEQDAYIASNVNRFIRDRIAENKPKAEVLDEVRRYKPSRRSEQTYAKDPHIWRRYLQWLYKMVMEKYPEQVSPRKGKAGRRGTLLPPRSLPGSLASSPKPAGE